MKLKLLESLLSVGSHAGYRLLEVSQEWLDRASKLAKAAFNAKDSSPSVVQRPKLVQQYRKFKQAAKYPSGAFRNAVARTPDSPEVKNSRMFSSAMNRNKIPQED